MDKYFSSESFKKEIRTAYRQRKNDIQCDCLMLELNFDNQFCYAHCCYRNLVYVKELIDQNKQLILKNRILKEKNDELKIKKFDNC